MSKPVTAVRIDTIRSQLSAIGTMATDIRLELDDLDALAWERTRTPRTDSGRVTGTGERDYALDTHGSPTARAALNTLKSAITRLCQDFATALDEASYVLRQGDDGHGVVKSGTMISHAEHLDALAAQVRRIESGEVTTSHRRLPQPGRDRALKAAVKRAERLEAENKNLRRRLDRAEQRLKAVDHRIPENLHDDWIARPPDPAS